MRRRQSFGAGLDHSRTGFVCPELYRGLTVGHTDIAVYTESNAAPRGKLTGTGHYGQRHRGIAGHITPRSVLHSHLQHDIIRPIRTHTLVFVRCQHQTLRFSFHRPRGRLYAPVHFAVPIPCTFGNTEIIHDTHLAHDTSGNTAVVETTPYSLPAPPRQSLISLVFLQIAPPRCILSRTVGRHAAVFGHHGGNTRLLKIGNDATVSIVSGNIAQQVYPVLAQGTLCAADGCRTRRVELPGQSHAFLQ